MLSTVWTRDCKTPEEKKARETLLLNSQLVFRVLKKVIEDERLELEREEVQSTSFENPSWASKQAFLLGRKNQMRKLLDLLSFV